MAHKSVLLKEAIDGLCVERGDIYLDATVGSGGHMEEVWKRTRGAATLIGIDADEVSLDITKEKLSLLKAKIELSILNFRHIDKVEEIFGKKPNKILFDLGWSSDQFESGERGFSFQKDEPLVMTFSKYLSEEDTTAYDVVNIWQQDNLADIIYCYGEEKYARRIAKAIVEERQKRPIKTSRELSEIIKKAVPVFYRFGRIHPATKTFQAIRIAVNDELRTLENGLNKAFYMLPDKGRMAVISFHSLEDRIVKNFFKKMYEEKRGLILTKKPIIPQKEEIMENPRARSAKLRIIEKTK